MPAAVILLTLLVMLALHVRACHKRETARTARIAERDARLDDLFRLYGLGSYRGGES